MPKNSQLPQVKTSQYPLTGGLDVASPQESIAPGMVLKLINFEPNITGGYRRVDGFSKIISPAVTGSGSVLGCWVHKGNTYAFRDDGTGKIKMYKANTGTSAWDLIPFYNVLKYNNGVFAEGALVVGNTITGKSSGTVGTIKKIIKYAGSYSVNAEGYLVVQITSGAGYTLNEPLEKVVATNAIVSGTAIPAALYGMGCGLLPDGRVIKTGGAALTSAVHLGTVAGDVITWASATALPMAVHSHSLTVLDTARVLVCGGYISTGATISCTIGIISGSAVQWVDSTPLPVARHNHAATLLNDGRVLVTGGVDSLGGDSNECYIGTITNSSIAWVQTDSLPAFSSGHTLTKLSDNRVLVTGGYASPSYKNNTYIGTISGDVITWVASTAIPAPLSEHAAVLLNDNRVYISGGITTGGAYVGTSYFGTISSTAITWVSSATLPEVIASHSLVKLSDGRSCQIGGSVSGVTTANVRLSTVAGGVIASCSLASYAIELITGSNKFRFINYNFMASTDTFYMYGCDGVNPAFEFDGSTITPILMPTLPDAPFNNAPKSITAHNGYLWLAFAKGSLQKSVIGEPLIWSGFLGAAEFGLGYEITDIVSILDTALMVATEKHIYVMAGKTELDFTLTLLSDNTSCLPNTAKVSVRPLLTTSKGIIRIDPSQNYGNFTSNSLSRMVQPLLDSWLSTKTLIGATISRTKNQYRLYFSDGTGIALTQDALYVDQKLPAFSTFKYGKTISCIASVDDDSSAEISLFGDSSGFVYREFTGITFDGAAIPALMVTPFLSLGSKVARKAFKKIGFDISNSSPGDIQLSYCLSDGQAHTSKQPYDSVTTATPAQAWSETSWAGETVTIPIVDEKIISVDGTGHNIAVAISSNSTAMQPFLLSSFIFHFLPRRANRG
jgi:hypothetical protein